MAFFIVLGGASNSISPEVSHLTSRIAKNGWHGQIVFPTALTVVCVTGIVPPSILVIAAGIIYGFGKGVWLSMIGVSAGSLLGVLVAHCLFRDVVCAWVDRRPSFRTLSGSPSKAGIVGIGCGSDATSGRSFLPHIEF